MVTLDELEALLQSGKKDEAFKLIRDYKGITAGILINEGIYFGIIGKYDLSILYFEIAKKIEDNINTKEAIRKNLSIVYNIRGTAYVEVNRYKEAVEDFNKAIELDAKNIDAYTNLLVAYRVLRQYEDVIRILNKLIDEYPDNATSYNDRGEAYYQLKQYKESIKDLNKGLIFNPNYAGIYLNLGLCCYHLGQYKDAIRYYNKAIELRPKFSDVYFNRGLVYESLEQYEKCFADYNKAIEINPNDADYYYERGLYYFESEKYKEGLRDFNKSIKLDPYDYESYLNRGNTYFLLNKKKKAVEDFNKAIELNPSDHRAIINRGNVYFKLRLYEKAIKDFNTAIELNPNFAIAYFNRGLSFLERNEDLDKAIEDFKLARDLAVADGIFKDSMLGFIEWAKARKKMNMKHWDAFRERMNEARELFENISDPLARSLEALLKVSSLDEELDAALNIPDPIEASKKIGLVLKNPPKIDVLTEPEKTIFGARFSSFAILRDFINSIRGIDESTDLEVVKVKLTELLEASKGVEAAFESVKFIKGKTAIVDIQEIISSVREEIGKIERAADKKQTALRILTEYWSRLGSAIKMMNGISTRETENIALGREIKIISGEVKEIRKEIHEAKEEILERIYETKNILVQKDVINARYRIEFPPSPSPAKIIVDIPIGDLTDEQIEAKAEEITGKIKNLKNTMRHEFLKALKRIPIIGEKLLKRLKDEK